MNFLRPNCLLNFGGKFATLIIRIISNLFEKLCEQEKKWLISQIVKLIAFLILFYQIILVTVSYLNYETYIDMKTTFEEIQRPAFTFCLKNKDKFAAKNLTILDIKFDHPISCRFNGFVYNCSEMTRIIESVTSHSRKCVSYFSQLYDEKPSPDNEMALGFIISDEINVYALVHQNSTPPHFSDDKIEISKSGHNYVEYSAINMNLLPFPYETDCFDYKGEEKSLIRYKSREDCVVKHLEQRELAECGCNKRWSYRELRSANFSNICPKTFKCDLNLKSKTNLLRKVCKKNCLIHYFIYVIAESSYFPNYYNAKFSVFSPYKMIKHDLKFAHLPKMNLLEYFCSVGGLISMWFGISVYDLTLIFFRKSKKRIIYLLGLIESELKIFTFFHSRNLIKNKFNRFFSKIIMILFSALMFYHSITLIINFFDYETVTRFEVQEIKSMPNIMIMKESKNTIRMAKEFIDIYPQIRNIKPSILVNTYGMEIFKWKLLSDNKLNDFERIVGSEKLIKTCHITTDNKVINFSKIDLGVVFIENKFYLFHFLNHSLIENNKIERLIISFFDFDQTITIKLEPNNINQYLFEANKKFRHKISFGSYLTQKLNSSVFHCISDEKNGYFNDEYFEFCFNDCSLNESINKYGCIAPFQQFYVFIDRNIRRNGNKLCNDTHSIDYPLIYNKCQQKCLPKCKFTNFEFKLQVSNHSSNETIVEFIPKKSPRIAYIETLKTDLDRLIYNCGGIFGLWFGLTPTKAVDLLRFPIRLSTYLREKRKRIAHYLLSILKRFIIFTIATLFKFIRNLFANLSLISQILIAFCVRCFQTSFSYFISFVYQLIAVFKICINFTITISYRFIRNLFVNLSLFTHNLISLCI